MTTISGEVKTRTCNSCHAEIEVDMTIDLIVRARNHEGTAGAKHRAVFCLLCWHEQLEPKLEHLHNFGFAGQPVSN